MAESSSSENVRLRELDIREKEITTERILGLAKIITTGVVVTLIPAILTHLIQRQELEIQTLKGEIQYLKEFSEKVVERDDLIKRRNYVQYLATVAHSEDSRERWKEYLKIVRTSAKKQEEIDKALAEKSAKADKEEKKITVLLNKLKSINAQKSNEIEILNKQLMVAQNNLQFLDEEIRGKTAEREALIKLSKLSSGLDNKDQEISMLILQTNSKERSVRLSAVQELIEQHRTSSDAISLAVDSLSIPLIDSLSASGRINILVYLRNTAKSAWSANMISRGKQAIEMMRRRDSEGIAQIGPQTEDALKRFDEFLSSIDVES